MGLLEIKTYPSKILGEKTEPVSEFGSDIQRLIDDMIETMYAAPGIGLAAPQVGVQKSLIVIDVSLRDKDNTPLLVLMNPQIIKAEGEIDSEEGCLSLPEYTAAVKRAERVVVRGLDREGKTIQVEGAGLLSRVLQHEIDHLNGILLIDRISKIKREFFKKRHQKALAKA